MWYREKLPLFNLLGRQPLELIFTPGNGQFHLERVDTACRVIDLLDDGIPVKGILVYFMVAVNSAKKEHLDL